MCWTTGLFAALTIAMTWPQIVRPSAVPDHVDAYFSLWRLAWIAHQLPLDPWHLFDANIFWPEPRTLAYSDALLLEGVIATPLIRAGLPVVYAYNLLVLGSFLVSGVSMFLLARHLTGETLPAVLAGLVFAFVPYRFDHYYHLELLWAPWMPLTFWMAARVLERGRVADGLGAGAGLALQTLSSIYYGVVLGTALVVFVVTWASRVPPARRRPVVIAFSAGAMLAGVVASIYFLQYVEVRRLMGDRNAGEALLYAAGPRHYLACLPENLLEGPLLGTLGRPEKRLFPGFVALVLCAIAVWPPWSRKTVAYSLVLAIAVDLSFGPRGLAFTWLRDHVFVYRGLRAPARFGQLAIFAFAVLAALGCARLRAWLVARTRRADAVIAAVLLAAFAEYLVRPLALVAVPTAAPAAYVWLRQQPAGVVAEFPTPVKRTLPFHEGEFAFLSSFHWHPLMNGYSGNWTPRYVDLIAQVSRFPDNASMSALRATGVAYVLVHERYYGREQYRDVVDRLRQRSDAVLRGRFDDDGFEIAAYELVR